MKNPIPLLLLLVAAACGPLEDAEVLLCRPGETACADDMRTLLVCHDGRLEPQRDCAAGWPPGAAWCADGACRWSSKP